jgi:hypothetical protein
MRYLEGFVKEGTRMFVKFDEVAVRALVRGIEGGKFFRG